MAIYRHGCDSAVGNHSIHMSIVPFVMMPNLTYKACTHYSKALIQSANVGIVNYINFSKDEFSASLLNCIAESLTVFSQTTLKFSSPQSRCKDLTTNKTSNHVIIQPNWSVVLDEAKRSIPHEFLYLNAVWYYSTACSSMHPPTKTPGNDLF